VGAVLLVLWLIALTVLAALSAFFARGVAAICYAVYCGLAIFAQVAFYVYAMIQAMAHAG
jgi:hypothetical protein